MSFFFGPGFIVKLLPEHLDKIVVRMKVDYVLTFDAYFMCHF